LGACSLLSTQAMAQPVACHLSAQGDASFVGECLWDDVSGSIHLSRPVGATDALWAGTIQVRNESRPIEISTYQYSTGPRLIVRTGAWHTLDDFSISSDGLRLAWSEDVEAPPSQIDLEIFLAARELLHDEEVWDREDDRDCENDESLISLYCALARATADKMGRYQHRQPAMQAVRRVIALEWQERVVDHRLMNFNNDPRTSLGDIRRLFDLAETSLRGLIR
jgi:hypothetical protein